MNQSLTGLVNDVYTLTNRPDLVGETLLAVRNATLKAHNTDFYDKDLFETGLQFDIALAQQSLEYKAFIPRWRALKYLRACDIDFSGTACPKKFLDIVTPDQLLDNYNINRNNVCYVAGAEIKIRYESAQQYFLIGAYTHPDVTPDNYKSWIAEEQPAAIIYAAAAIIFKTIGFDEQNAAYQSMIADEYVQLRMSNIQAHGY